MRPGLRIDNLCDKIGRFSVGPISLSISEGEYLAILGPTGCGKTSLLRALCGLSPHATGTVVINDEQINGLPPNKRRIGYVTQLSDLFPHMTVRDNVEFGMAYLSVSKKEKADRIARYLNLFRLDNIAAQPAATVSGGEAKRTAMARALVIEPRLLLLDEPLGMLDYNGRKVMMDILKLIHTELKTTTIHVTHDRYEAWRVADTCAVMDEGKIVQTSSVNDLFRTPKSVFVADFLGGKNIFEAEFCGKTASVPWGAVELPCPVSESKGYIVIRPERLRISPDSNKSLLCSVNSKRDCGDYIEIICGIDRENVFYMHAPYDEAVNLSVGDKISVTWATDAVHVITGQP